jgi:hypothetical protein
MDVKWWIVEECCIDETSWKDDVMIDWMNEIILNLLQIVLYQLFNLWLEFEELKIW